MRKILSVSELLLGWLVLMVLRQVSLKNLPHQQTMRELVVLKCVLFFCHLLLYLGCFEEVVSVFKPLFVGLV